MVTQEPGYAPTSKKATSRVGRMILLSSGILVALGLALWAPRGDINAEDRALAARILETQGLTLFRAVLPGEWDEVCYLDPYSFPSRRMPTYLPEIGTRLRFLGATGMLMRSASGWFSWIKGRTRRVSTC